MDKIVGSGPVTAQISSLSSERRGDCEGKAGSDVTVIDGRPKGSAAGRYVRQDVCHHINPPSPKTPTLPRQLHGFSVLSRSARGVGDLSPRGPRSPWCCEPSPAVSVLPRLLAPLVLLALVCTRRRLLVLLSRLVNSVKLPRFALDVERRCSV